MKLGTLLFLFALCPSLFAPSQKPNVVVILCDNLGNGDIACFNPQTKHRTPNLDRMAAEGMKFTSFYSATNQNLPLQPRTMCSSSA